MTTVTCPVCGETADARRLDWNDLTEERSVFLPGFSSEEMLGGLEMGPHVYRFEPDVHAYRRVRRCSSCEMLFATVEVSEAVLAELGELRGLVRAINEEAARMSSAANKIRRLLKEAGIA